MLDGSYFLECDCGSFRCTHRFVKDKEYGVLYLDVNITYHQTFFQRLRDIHRGKDLCYGGFCTTQDLSELLDFIDVKDNRERKDPLILESSDSKLEISAFDEFNDDDPWYMFETLMTSKNKYKFLFGQGCRFGWDDCFELDENEQRHLVQLINYYQGNRRKFIKSLN